MTMTKKDFTLIADAINAGIENFLKDPMLTPGEASGRQPLQANSTMSERLLRIHLSQAFAEKLPYTNDSFNAEIFKRAIRDHELVTAPRR
jgi:hypothetical protein